MEDNLHIRLEFDTWTDENDNEVDALEIRKAYLFDVNDII